MLRVLVTAPCREAARRAFEEQFADRCAFSFREDARDLGDAEVVIGEPSLEAVRSAESLRWIQMTWAGINIYTREPGFPEHVLLTNASGVFGSVISEYILGALLAQYRHLFSYREQQRQHLWHDAGAERRLAGSRVLILGTGDIGSSISVRLHAFGTRNVGIRRTIGAPVNGFDEIDTTAHLDEWLGNADIVIGCLPGTTETEGLLDGRRLSLMRDDATLINVGRGSLIDTAALVHELQRGRFYSVILDVTDPEPLPADSPLWSIPRVFLTPHISGPSFGHARATEDAIWRLARENLRHYLAGEPLEHTASPRLGY